MIFLPNVESDHGNVGLNVPLPECTRTECTIFGSNVPYIGYIGNYCKCIYLLFLVQIKLKHNVIMCL